MAKRNIWVERKFEFALPDWMYPNVLERVRGGPARVEEVVRKIPTGIRTRRQGEKWSIQEHVGHLVDLESLWSRRLDELIEGSAQLTAWEETNRATHQADHNSKDLEAILSKFRENRSRFVDRLDTLDEGLIERAALHPRLQTPMRTIDLVFFVAEHDDHHLAEITRINRELTE